jgi:hypothetical protein
VIHIHISGNNDGTMQVYHVERYNRNSNEWKRPQNDEIQDIPEQIIPCAVEGSWNFCCRTGILAVVFELLNTDNVKATFEVLF